ncbi:MAG: 3-keto-5-aminohexanoate cleavage protein [Pseudomonadota bacterium]|nr:3-keto-5-aminohexanoate cleavage protein [Pseudomonadota bacterium]
MADKAPVIIAVAPNGARRTRADHPRLPLTPTELAACAQECLAAGASMMHLHVREPDGRHSLDPDRYAEAITTIRQRLGDDIILQVTTESGGRYAPHEQIQAIEELRPEAVSIAIRELFSEPSMETTVTAFLHALAARRTLVQYILYGIEDLRRCIALHAAGVIPQRRPSVLLVLGSYRDHRDATPAELMSLVPHLPQEWSWSTCAFGPSELRCVVTAALLGGHIRVGFENNLQLPWGETAPNNGALVQASVAALAPLALRAATCSEARNELAASCA